MSGIMNMFSHSDHSNPSQVTHDNNDASRTSAYTNSGPVDVQGKCHCGKLKWITHFPENKLPASFLCHCESCRKFGAGGYSVNAIIPKYYCKNCTVHAFHHEEVLGDRYTMHTLLLERGEENPEIGMEVFLGEKAKFQPKLPGTTGYEKTDANWADHYN
ncbi:Mss4-like protein [Pyronema domesticum]|nr:Mss4-like protein [Pyronema domesticum]